MSKNMIGNLECGICREIADDAIETTCCHQIFCTSCLGQLQNRKCPFCRKENFQSVESHFARRLIKELPTKCQFCEQEMTRGNLHDHQIRCPSRTFECPAPNCNHSSKRSEFIEHLVNIHGDKLTKNAAALFRENPVTPLSDNRTDPICTKRNANGKEARLGETGKYYCGGSLNYTCDCCNG